MTEFLFQKVSAKDEPLTLELQNTDVFRVVIVACKKALRQTAKEDFHIYIPDSQEQGFLGEISTEIRQMIGLNPEINVAHFHNLSGKVFIPWTGEKMQGFFVSQMGNNCLFSTAFETTPLSSQSLNSAQKP